MVKILLKRLRRLRTVINGKLFLTLISFLGSLIRTCTRLFYGLYSSSEPEIAPSLGSLLLSSAANSSISSTSHINCAARGLSTGHQTSPPKSRASDRGKRLDWRPCRGGTRSSSELSPTAVAFHLASSMHQAAADLMTYWSESIKPGQLVKMMRL
jgi:hypothetical protein